MLGGNSYTHKKTYRELLIWYKLSEHSLLSVPYFSYRKLPIPVQFSSVQSLSRVRLFVTSWITARQASLSITNSRSSLRLTSIESVMPSSHLILCRPPLLLPPIPPSISVFSICHVRLMIFTNHIVNKTWRWNAPIPILYFKILEHQVCFICKVTTIRIVV